MPEQQERPREEIVFVRTERSRDEVVLSVQGPLYDEYGDRFAAEIDALLAGPWPIVTLDLSKVKAMASKPMGQIVKMKTRLEPAGRRFRIRGCDPGLYAEMLRFKFDRIVDLQP